MRNSLRKIRKARGLTQQQLGEKTGYDFRTVAGYEKIGARISSDFLQKAAEALGCSPTEILESDSDFPQKPAPYYQPGLTSFEMVSSDLLEKIFVDLLNQTLDAEFENRDRIIQTMLAVNKELWKRTKPT